jgi:hypothetical protein
MKREVIDYRRKRAKEEILKRIRGYRKIPLLL